MKRAALAALAFATAVSSGAPAAPPSAPLPSADRKFLTEAAQGGLAEIELGKLAVEKASNPDVKAFGHHMMEDHGKANEDLRKLADAKGVAVPSALDAKEARLRDKLATLSGAAFDRAYVDAMVKDHKHDVAEFEKQSAGAHDPDVAAFATRTLPTLREHLARVEGISKAMKGGHETASRGM